jgi:DNA-binding XRE family transcriptional regulator
MAPLREGYRFRVVPSTYGGGAQRWVLLYSEQRQPHAQHAVDKQWRKHSDEEVKAFKRLGRTAFACEADAQQALTSFAAGLQTTLLHASTICPTPRYGKRGRPGPGTQPEQLVYHITGALAARLTERWARIDQQSCFLLATNELDEAQLPAPAVLDGYKGQSMPRTLPQIVGERVVLLRRRKGLTQPELAHRTKMGITTLNRIEKAHHSTSIDKLVALARELGCSADYLLGLSDDPGSELLPAAAALVAT